MDYHSLKDFFDVLNNKVDYLVLRNYESFFSGSFMEDHPDIDILCTHPNDFLDAVSSYPRTKNKKDTIHRAVVIDGKAVAVDVRYVGDGYYCTAWEKEMLRTKEMYHSLCHVLNTENYYYSLLYHVHIQKDVISEDYMTKLSEQASALGLPAEEALSLRSLQHYMRERGYVFTYPVFPGGKAHFERVDKSMVERNPVRQIHRFLFKVKRRLKILCLWERR